MKSISSLLVGLLAYSLLPAVWAQSTGWTPELAMRVKRVSHVRVSPDGKRVAFVVSQAVMDSEKSEWLSQIHLAASDGTGAMQLTQGDRSATNPEWSPDGQWIAFASARGGKPEADASLWRIRVVGGEAGPLRDETCELS